MMEEDKIKEFILKAMKNVRDSDPTYNNWVLTENTVVLGTSSPMDSIAFTALVTDLEEKIEDEIHREFTLKIEALYDPEEGVETNLSVSDVAKRLIRMIDSRKA